MFSVVLDACVLYPAYLRDTLLRMAAVEMYRPLWTGTILDELLANLPETMTPAARQGLRDAMVDSFPDAEVTGYGALIPSMTNDPKDRHVLAAAVRASASAIVTFNLDDFPPSSTEPYDLEVLHPDEFLLNQLDLSPASRSRSCGDRSAGIENRRWACSPWPLHSSVRAAPAPPRNSGCSARAPQADAVERPRRAPAGGSSELRPEGGPKRRITPTLDTTIALSAPTAA